MLLAGSPSALAGAPPPRPGELGLAIHSSLSASQRKWVETDESRLRSIEVSVDVSPDTQRLLGLTTITGETLYAWLRERITYLFGPELKPSALITQSHSPRYAHPDEFPILESNHATNSTLANLGTSLYFEGKTRGETKAIRWSLFKKVTIQSPRTGAALLEGGFFQPERMPNPLAPQSYGNSLGRIASLFHQARHSDGNGISLGFFHAVCDSGAYKGLPACDRNLNGPWTIQGSVQQLLTENCKAQQRCTNEELEVLRLDYLDSFSRVIRSTPLADDQDVTREMTRLEEQLHACEAMPPEQRAEVPSLCGDLVGLEGKIAQLRESLGRSIPSLEWDATPEAAFDP